ncbi:MAG TPA: hypothetical protein VL049_21105 [Candidatus Dormibacteraeota bacterium]|nr:hypothetical protein [Candidatus Dormibacteraeota bacterium]
MTMGIGGARRAAWMLVVGAVLAPAVVQADDPELSVVGASGLRGGTVAVIIRLANDATNTAFTADVDIAFPTDLLELFPPVRTTCTIAPRLAATHQVAGRLPEPGLLVLSIPPSATTNNPLGNGDLASCAFHILPDAASSPAALTIQSPLLGDSNGEPLPLIVADGAVLITDAPNQPTPTVVPNRCVADCSGDGTLTVDEVIRGVNIALDNFPLTECPAADANGDGAVTIGELIEAVRDVINGC